MKKLLVVVFLVAAFAGGFATGWWMKPGRIVFEAKGLSLEEVQRFQKMME